MRRQAPLLPLPDRLAELFESLRDPADAALKPGFYERVNDRIQSSRPVSIWSFAQTSACSYLAIVLGALTLLIGFAVVQESKEFAQELGTTRTHETVPVAGTPGEQRDAVLENIAVYSSR